MAGLILACCEQEKNFTDVWMRSTPSVMMNYACAYTYTGAWKIHSIIFLFTKVCTFTAHSAHRGIYYFIYSRRHIIQRGQHCWIELCYAFAAVAHQESNANEFVLASRMLIALAQSIIIIISPSVSNARILTSPHTWESPLSAAAAAPNMESNAAESACMRRGDMLAIL